jgi:hypothetical protein
MKKNFSRLFIILNQIFIKARSSIFVHTNNSIEGLSTIRTARVGPIVNKEFGFHYNNHTRAYFTFVTVHRWFGLRLDLLCSCYTIITLFSCILLKSIIELDETFT